MTRWIVVVTVVGLLALGTSGWAPVVRAAEDESATDQDAGQDTTVQPAATDDSGGAASPMLSGTAPKRRPKDHGGKPSDEASSETQEASTEEKSEEAAPETDQAVVDYERKLTEVDRLVAEAERIEEQVATVETKVNEKVAGMTDGAKRRADTAELREEIKEGHPSATAKAYRDLTLHLATAQQKLVTAYGKALGRCDKVVKIEAPNESLKVRGDALLASLKDKTISALLKQATIYERVSETQKMDLCYKQILGIDKENSAALSYFKEKEAKKE
ncbi:MAG: hypothetical protein JXL80_10690 [Planctomycetes bacterium]|nr:hypothetical protein [Planctomycetota bacterium]